jgi:hypothetical protein
MVIMATAAILTRGSVGWACVAHLSYWVCLGDFVVRKLCELFYVSSLNFNVCKSLKNEFRKDKNTHV